MILFINGSETDLDQVSTIEDVVTQLGYKGSYFAVALNHLFISRSRYDTTKVKERDSIEILTPMQGG